MAHKLIKLLSLLAISLSPLFFSFADAECELEGKIKSFGVEGRVITLRVINSDGSQNRLVKFCSQVSHGEQLAPTQSAQSLEFIRFAMRNNSQVCMNSSGGFFESCIDEVKIRNARFNN